MVSRQPVSPWCDFRDRLWPPAALVSFGDAAETRARPSAPSPELPAAAVPTDPGPVAFRRWCQQAKACDGQPERATPGRMEGASRLWWALAWHRAPSPTGELCSAPHLAPPRMLLLRGSHRPIILDTHVQGGSADALTSHEAGAWGPGPGAARPGMLCSCRPDIFCSWCFCRRFCFALGATPMQPVLTCRAQIQAPASPGCVAQG